jgi:hypothetical protein
MKPRKYAIFQSGRAFLRLLRPVAADEDAASVRD